MNISELRTPQVLVERDRLLANIERMQTGTSRRGIRLRPHAKTHKSPTIARWQIDRGAIGICCAKLGEAEVFADAGISDIRLPYPVNPVNADRVLALLDRVRLSLIVDHPDVAAEWASAMRMAGRTLDVLVKVDVGFHRCGIAPRLETAVPFVERIARLRGLSLRGLLSHAGHAYHAPSPEAIAAIARDEGSMLNEIASALRDKGIPIEEVSVGATPTARFSLDCPGVTEMRPGNYVYLDRSQVALGAGTLHDCALTVLATVVSTPAADRVILDCGSKTLSSDGTRGMNAGYGAVLNDDGVDETLRIERLSEEHATVAVLNGASRLRPGDRVRVLPNHSCVVSNLVDRVMLVNGEEVVEALDVAARGKIQ